MLLPHNFNYVFNLRAHLQLYTPRHHNARNTQRQLSRLSTLWEVYGEVQKEMKIECRELYKPWAVPLDSPGKQHLPSKRILC